MGKHRQSSQSLFPLTDEYLQSALSRPDFGVYTSHIGVLPLLLKEVMGRKDSRPCYNWLHASLSRRKNAMDKQLFSRP